MVCRCGLVTAKNLRAMTICRSEEHLSFLHGVPVRLESARLESTILATKVRPKVIPTKLNICILAKIAIYLIFAKPGPILCTGYFILSRPHICPACPFHERSKKERGLMHAYHHSFRSVCRAIYTDGMKTWSQAHTLIADWVYLMSLIDAQILEAFYQGCCHVFFPSCFVEKNVKAIALIQ